MRSTALFACLLPALLAGVCTTAHGQQGAVMPVSVTVVNTCQFGVLARCALAGTRIMSGMTLPSPAARVALGLSGTAAPAQHLILHL